MSMWWCRGTDHSQTRPVFREFAFDAACHHEKLDGSGYPHGYRGDRLSAAARTLAVADITRRQTLEVSLMPPGLTADLTMYEFASLLDYPETLGQ